MNQILNNNILQWQPFKRTMTYIDFVTIFPRAERIKHCNFAEIEKDVGHKHAIGKNKNKVGQILGPGDQRDHAIVNLKNFILDEYNIELIGPQTQAVNLCHLCEHNSHINEKDSTKHTCTCATHVYFGTASENANDVDYKIMIKGSQTQLNSGNHNSQIKDKCQHCEWETTEFALTKHINACHFNPTSYNYLKPILRHDRKKGYQNKGLGHKLIELELMIAENYNSRHQ